MGLFDTKTLAEERGQLVHDMRQITETVAKDKRPMNNEEKQLWDRCDSRQEEIAEQLDTERRLAKAEALFTAPTAKTATVEDRSSWQSVSPRSNGLSLQNPIHNPSRDEEACLRAFGLGAIEENDVEPESFNRSAYKRYAEVADRCKVNYRRNSFAVWDRNDTSPESLAVGYMGATVPTTLANYISLAQKYVGPMWETSTVLRTGGGETYNLPQSNDLANQGYILGINSADTVNAIDTALLSFGAFKYSSNMVLVPLELFQDAKFDIVPYIGTILGKRLGRAQNSDFTTGDTSGNNPRGIVTDAAVGVSATASATAITYGEFVQALESLDEYFLRDPACAWMVSKGCKQLMKQLVDGNGRPLWNVNFGDISKGQPDTFLGYKVYVNPNMAAPTAGNVPALVGALNYYTIRAVAGAEGDYVLKRSDDRFIEYFQTVFIGFQRVDGKLNDAGDHPVRKITMHS